MATKRQTSGAGTKRAKGGSRQGQGGSRAQGAGAKKDAATPETRSRPANPNILERGDIFFFYRPDVEEESPTSLLDVRRFHVVLRPGDSDVLRLLTIGRKTLPGEADGDRNHWGFVERVFRDPGELRQMLAGGTYETETRGDRHLPAARPVGEGVYCLARRGRSSILAYALELPAEPGEVQRAFHIEKQGHFVLSVKNPEAARPPGIGLDEEQKAEFPDELMERFGARKWIAADPPEFLNYEGAEIVLIGGRDEEAGQLANYDLEPDPEDETSADVFQELELERSDRAVGPLFEGTWE
jgi:hypothetical protein